MDVRLRENTMYTKRYIIDLKIKPYFEKKILSEITVADVRAWQNELLTYKDKNGKGYSPTYLKTVNCQELICKGWFLPPNTYDCGSFVVN